MIISPPFLPARANQTDDAWIDAAMPLDLRSTEPPRGIFPVSRQLGWHGGVHLVAPKENNVPLPVRAIADGQIVFMRQNSMPPADLKSSPLHYNPAQTGPARTDNGCVVIRHQTEIGAAPGTANADGAATTLTYYSVYMHLDDVTCITDAPVSESAPVAIYRKDKIGTAGRIYGESDRIHFEIVFDDAALVNLLGRSSREADTPVRPTSPEYVEVVKASEDAAANTPKDRTLDLLPTDDGRLDAVFGEIYFRLPIGTKFYAGTTPPDSNVTEPTAAVVYTLTAERFVGMKFAAGSGEEGHRGDIIYQTYLPDGTPEGQWLFDQDGEYNLYTRATQISHAYPDGERPAPSAVFELLRFGRIVDTAHETLSPADVPMWTYLNYPGGHGYVNLRRTGVKVYSDADLPQWKGWKLVDSDTDGDSRCDASSIRAILDENRDGTITPDEATKRIGDPEVRRKLSRFLCKMPTEWDAANIDKRYGWLLVQTDENPTPLEKSDADKSAKTRPVFHEERDYKPFKAHVEAQCFWDAATIGLEPTHWHAHPIEFIRHFRKCGWMSAREFAQCLPRRNYILRKTVWQIHDIFDWDDAIILANTWAKPVNMSSRKYGISESKQRWNHFIAQLTEESGFFQFVKETGGGSASYAPYYGRGLIQLTHMGNYKTYGKYRAFKAENTVDPQFSDIKWDPDVLIARSNTQYNSHNCADSAGIYWCCNKMTATGVNALSLSDQGQSISDIIQTSRSTNGNVPVQNINGLGNRLQSFVFAKYTLLDLIRVAPTESMAFTWRRNSETEPIFDSNNQKVMVATPDGKMVQKYGFIAGNHTIEVILEQQKP